jgi:hypothetical protein
MVEDIGMELALCDDRINMANSGTQSNTAETASVAKEVQLTDQFEIIGTCPT